MIGAAIKTLSERLLHISIFGFLRLSREDRLWILLEDLDVAKFGDDFLHRFLPVLWLLSQHTQNHAIHFRGDVFIDFRRCGRHRREVLHQQVFGRISFEGRRAGEAFIDGDAETVDVRLRRQRLFANRLWRDVRQGSTDFGVLSAEQISKQSFDLFRQREVNQFHFGRAIEQDVVRLHVEMNPSSLVHVL